MPLQAEEMLGSAIVHDVGCVALTSAFLDNFIERMIWQLFMRGEEFGRIFTDRIQLDAKTDLLKELTIAALKTKESKDKFLKIWDQIKSAIPERNDIIHGEWVPAQMYVNSETQAIKIELPYATRVKRDTKRKISSTRCGKVARNMERALKDLKSFYRFNGAELFPEPHKTHEQSLGDPQGQEPNDKAS